jgi:hypothetical protein
MHEHGPGGKGRRHGHEHGKDGQYRGLANDLRQMETFHAHDPPERIAAMKAAVTEAFHGHSLDGA